MMRRFVLAPMISIALATSAMAQTVPASGIEEIVGAPVPGSTTVAGGTPLNANRAYTTVFSPEQGDAYVSLGNLMRAVDQQFVAPAVQALQAHDTQQAGQIAALQSTQAALGAQVEALFDLQKASRRDVRKGVAAALAVGNPPMPSSPGATSYALDLATFRGEQAVGGSIMHRLRADKPVAVSASISFAGKRNNGARVGIAGEF